MADYQEWLSKFSMPVQEMLGKITDHYGMLPQKWVDIWSHDRGPSWEVWLTKRNLIRGWKTSEIIPDHFYCLSDFRFDTYVLACNNCTTLDSFLNVWDASKNAYYFHHQFEPIKPCCANLLGLYHLIRTQLTDVCCVADHDCGTMTLASCQSTLVFNKLHDLTRRCTVKVPYYARGASVELQTSHRSIGHFEFADINMGDKLVEAIKQYVNGP